MEKNQKSKTELILSSIHRSTEISFKMESKSFSN